VNVRSPVSPAWDLSNFVDGLRAEGVVISDFYHTPEPGFRVGCIGAIEPSDMEVALNGMANVLDRLGIHRRGLKSPEKSIVGNIPVRLSPMTKD
jgi:aspartate aminotransferase-like enzyme